MGIKRGKDLIQFNYLIISNESFNDFHITY